MEARPLFTQLHTSTFYDNSVQKTSQITIGSSANTLDMLNRMGDPLRFEFFFNYPTLLSSPNSGMQLSLSFKTRAGNPLGNDRNGDIALSNNFFFHLFEQAFLEIENKTVEEIKHLGIIRDIETSLSDSKYRNKSGIFHTYCPDTTNDVSNDTIQTPQVEAAGPAATLAEGVRDIPNKTLTLSHGNSGYHRRKRQ